MQTTNNENFEKDVLQEEMILVDFSADWCGPCRMMLPLLEEIQQETSIKIIKVNIDECPDIAAKYDVMSIPTLILFKNGEKVSSNIGSASKARIVDWIESHN